MVTAIKMTVYRMGAQSPLAIARLLSKVGLAPIATTCASISA